MPKIKDEALKIAARKGKEKFRDITRYDNWTKLLIQMAKIQTDAMAAGQKTARKHLIAILKELEMHVGFRFELITPGEPNDPRRG